MDDRPGRRVRDEQADVVTGETAGLGRLVRLEEDGRLERGDAHAETPASSRAR